MTTSTGLDIAAFLETIFDGRRGLPILDVRLRVREPTASWARERYYHPTQELDDVDGGVEIRFRAGAPGAIVARVLSLGPDCEVVAPASLRRAVAARARELAARYAGVEGPAAEKTTDEEEEKKIDAAADPGPDLSGGAGTSTSRPTAARRARAAESETSDDDDHHQGND